MIRHVMFYLNKNKVSVYEAASCCAELCHAKDIVPYFFKEDETDIRLNMPKVMAYSGLREVPVPGEIDMIFVFGGDGTMLRALDSYVSCDIPMLGINLGRMGFLLETEVDDMAQAIEQLCAAQYNIERRMMLRVEGVAGGKVISAYATNEVSISRGLSQRMIAMDAYAGKMLVDHYIADGLVLSSPTGSTAYSLSAGGPIVSPDVTCFVLNPICPHSLQSRPIVLPANQNIRLRLNMKEMREGILLSVDGQAVCEMHNQEEVSIVRSPHDALLVRFFDERNFFSLLKDKLSQWSL